MKVGDIPKNLTITAVKKPKSIYFLGYPLSMDEDRMFISIDETGGIYAYTDEPKLIKEDHDSHTRTKYWWSVENGFGYEHIGIIHITSDNREEVLKFVPHSLYSIALGKFLNLDYTDIFKIGDTVEILDEQYLIVPIGDTGVMEKSVVGLWNKGRAFLEFKFRTWDINTIPHNEITELFGDKNTKITLIDG